MERDPALKPGPVALLTPAASRQEKMVVFGHQCSSGQCTLPLAQFLIFFPGWTVCFFARGADPLAEPGRQDAEHGVGEVERIAAKVEKPDHGFHSAIGVQRTEDQMAGERRFNRMSAVSLSRISPIIMTSGSARRKARIAVAKSSPIFWWI